MEKEIEDFIYRTVIVKVIDNYYYNLSIKGNRFEGRQTFEILRKKT